MRSSTWGSGFAALYLGQFLAHQTGLTFSALIPIVGEEWRLSASQAGLILGVFQLGTLAAYVAVGFLLDRVRSKPIMVWSAALVGTGDLLFALGARDFVSGFALRLLVGVLIGGLYLPALKHIADTVPPERRGLATGIYIGVIVVAYAAPLFYIGVFAPAAGWRAVMAGVGIAELCGALVMAWGVPAAALPASPLSPRPAAVRGGQIGLYVRDILRNRPARRVITAYTAHNWELFGMWGWLAPFMVASLGARGSRPEEALALGGTLAAAAIGLGGCAGAVIGGRLSDRLGRARAASLMLGTSFLCSAGFGWLFAAPVGLVLGVSLVFGIVALADSPAYSAGLMELVPPRSLGGAFSLQMLFGWTATAIAPAVFGATLDLARAAQAGPTAQWGWAFGTLALGPVVGMMALRPLLAVTASNGGSGRGAGPAAAIEG